MSEHIAWNVVGGTYLADLLPLPMTEEALEVVCRHVDQTQSHLKRRILVENPSTYIAFGNSIIPEWEFMTAVAWRTGCGILCDVNNICVSAHNHGWDRLGLYRRLAAGGGRRDPSGRTQRQDARRWQHPSHRRSRLAGQRRSLGPVSAGDCALRRGADPDRMGQRRAAAGGPARRGLSRRPPDRQSVRGDAGHADAA